MAARKTTTARRKAPAPDQCPVCKGSGEVDIAVMVGRRRGEKRRAGTQIGMCLTCLGSGEAPAT